MTVPTLETAARPEPGDPSVLFLNIGWAERYDGTETIEGNHSYLREHGDDCSEAAAFFPDDDGDVSVWLGRGAVNADNLDIVFVARRQGTNGHRVVGVYFDAEVFFPEAPDIPYARTADFHLFADIDARVQVDWPGRMGLRRWAYRASGEQHPSLYAVYRRLVDDLGRTPGQGRRARGIMPAIDLNPDEQLDIARGGDGHRRESLAPRDRSAEVMDRFRYSRFCALDPAAIDAVAFRPGQTLVEAVRGLLSRADLAGVAVSSFASNVGFFELAGLVKLVGDGRLPSDKLRFMFAPPAGCEPDLAHWLRQQAERGVLTAREFPRLEGRTMHVKALLAELTDGRRIAVTGSANATFAGIASNEEFSTAFTVTSGLGESNPFAWFDDAWRSAPPLDPINFVSEEVVVHRRPLFSFQLEAQAAFQRYIQPLLAKTACAGDEEELGGHGGGLLVLPTGAGKTLTTMRWLFNQVLPDRDRYGRVLWLSHRVELLQQAHDAAVRELHFVRGRKPDVVPFGIFAESGPQGEPFAQGDL